MLTLYRAVMDSNYNPLRNLPPAQRFQIMAFLSMMWTTIFCAFAGAWIWYGELMVGHLLVALGFLVTGITFHRANSTATYRDQPREDGTARYDDVWGA
jgi:fatty-acid desaturase